MMLPQTHSWLGEGRRGIPLPWRGGYPSPFLTHSRLGVFWHRGPLIPPKVWQPLTPLVCCEFVGRAASDKARHIARQSCAMVPRWRFLAIFLRPVFSASRVQQVSDLHLKFALRPHHVWKYGRHPISDGSD